MNTTIHGTMKTTPYELVYGQPPRQCLFPGVSGVHILEEDVEELLDGDSEHVPGDTGNYYILHLHVYHNDIVINWCYFGYRSTLHQQ